MRRRLVDGPVLRPDTRASPVNLNRQIERPAERHDGSRRNKVFSM